MKINFLNIFRYPDYKRMDRFDGYKGRSSHGGGGGGGYHRDHRDRDRDRDRRPEKRR